MRLRQTILTMALAAALTASAIPARRGVVHQFTQPDGTIVNLELVGDEHHHYYKTTDGQIVLADGDRYCYANIDALGRLTLTSMLAHNPAQRTIEEAETVRNIDPEQVRAKLATAAMSRANSQDGNGKLTSDFPTEGTVKSLVFLVSFSDLDFETENANEYFTNLLNQPGFAEHNAVGSCRDYYVDASRGKFIPEFDVYGPVKLPKAQSYYGRNSAFSLDVNVKDMLLHAGQLLDDEVDFSEYDLNDDGYVDNVYIFYAGYSEADGGGAECIWPHQSSIGFNYNYIFDNVQLNRYACGSELSGGRPDGIGTFCHEFGHVLGLCDLYNVNNDSEYTPKGYDLMDSGCYNADGRTPPTLSAFQRNALGWMGDDLVEITGPSSCTLEHLLTSGKAYLINTDKPDEFFIFENRQQQGWDAKIPGHGMLVWHIDYQRSVFDNNLANIKEDHQRVDLVEACNTTGSTILARRKYPFPGTSKVTSFTYDGAPSFTTWSGKDLGLPLTNISESIVDGIGTITFDVAGGGDDPAASIADVTMPSNISYTTNGDEITVTAQGTIVIADIMGRVIATGNDSLSARVAGPGIYIISCGGASARIAM